ncbi:MAG: cyclic nucleotide-binding domain-containing protein [Desulfobacterales bacterium]|nr:cyclic nucleotide-binding domain-containing protein [Desulfobacterales bacterium]
MIKVNDRFRHIWNLLMLAAITYTAIESPLRLVVHRPIPGWASIMDVIVTLLFGLDIIFNFSFSVLRRGRWISNPRIISQHYLKSWFILDMMAAFPFELIFSALLSPAGSGLFVRGIHLVRLAKLPKLWHYKKGFEYFLFVNFTIFRLVFFLYLIGLISHWIACGWYYLTVPHETAQDYVTAYLNSLYWCITTLTTVGYGDITPVGNVQKIYTMLVMMLGVGIYGYVIGNIALLIGNLDLAKARHQEKMEQINSFMIANRFSRGLQRRVKDYFSYLWHSRRGYDHAAVFSELPESFKLEFSFFLNRGIIEKVPMFKNAGEKLIKDIVTCLKSCIALPGDWVCRYGEIGDKMYFISRGAVEVVGPDGQEVYTTLSDGSFFGEIALLLSVPRNASVRAADYCELYSLEKRSFDRVLKDYPEFAREIEQEARKRMDKGKQES